MDNHDENSYDKEDDNDDDNDNYVQTELGAILTKEQGKPKGEAEGEVLTSSSSSSSSSLSSSSSSSSTWITCVATLLLDITCFANLVDLTTTFTVFNTFQEITYFSFSITGSKLLSGVLSNIGHRYVHKSI